MGLIGGVEHMKVVVRLANYVVKMFLTEQKKKMRPSLLAVVFGKIVVSEGEVFVGFIQNLSFIVEEPLLVASHHFLVSLLDVNYCSDRPCAVDQNKGSTDPMSGEYRG